jgi:hypothetical protein
MRPAFLSTGKEWASPIHIFALTNTPFEFPSHCVDNRARVHAMIFRGGGGLGSGQVAMTPCAARLRTTPLLRPQRHRGHARCGAAAPAPPRPRPAAAFAAAAAAAPSPDYTYNYSSARSIGSDPPVVPLPPPPDSAAPGVVAAYLARLALGERTMLWRVGLAFVFMVISKAAGGWLWCHTVGRGVAIPAPHTAAESQPRGAYSVCGWWPPRQQLPMLLPQCRTRFSPTPPQHVPPSFPGMAGPLFLKQAVDTLSSGAADALAAAVTAVVTFGLCGVIQHLAKELQHPTFTPVSQVGGGGDVIRAGGAD